MTNDVVRAGARPGGRSARAARRVRACGAALAVVAVAGTAHAQVPPGGSPAGLAAAEQAQRAERQRELQQIELDTRLRANEAIPPGQRLLVDYGAYLQFNYLSLDDSARNNHGLREGDFVPYLRLNFDGAQEVFLRGRLGYRDFNTGDSFTGRGDEPIDGDLERGFYRLDLARYNAAYGQNLLGAKSGESNVIVEGGRDFAYWANGLVLAQTLDGVFVDVTRGALDLQVVAGVTPVRTVDFDTSRPGFDFNTRRGFYGLMGSLRVGDQRPFAYGLIQRDYNTDDQQTLGLISTKYDYESFYLGLGSTGSIGDRLRYGVEFTYEGGQTLSNSFTTGSLGGVFPVEQKHTLIQAFGFDARLDYLLNDPHDTRLSGEVIIASGDPDRGSTTNTFNGNRAGTKDHAFNAFGLVNTGLAFAPDVSNLLAVRLGGSTFPLSDFAPFHRLQLGTDFFVLAKARSDAPIDEPTGDTRFLGIEPDVYINWQVTSDVTLAFRYGAFFPSNSAFGSNDVRQFFYGGLTLSF